MLFFKGSCSETEVSEQLYCTRLGEKSPKSGGICERFNKICKDGFYSIVFRKKIYYGIDEIQLDLDERVK
jgi:hypothetical protein